MITYIKTKMIHKIDETDIKILNILQNDGRITNLALAPKVGLTPPPTLRRLAKLEKNNVILSAHIKVNPTILQFSSLMFCDITYENKNVNDIKKFEEDMKKYPIVRECYKYSNENKFLIKLITKTIPDALYFIATELETNPNIKSIEKKIIIETVKDEFGLPLEILLNENQTKNL